MAGRVPRSVSRAVILIAVTASVVLFITFLGRSQRSERAVARGKDVRTDAVHPPATTDSDNNRETPQTTATLQAQKRSGRALYGVVVDEGGAPISDAVLYTIPHDAYLVTDREIGRFCTPVRSEETGRFTLEGAFESGHELICRKQGYVPVALGVSGLHQEVPLRIVLSSGGRLYGTVSDRSGIRLGGVQVRARAASIHCSANVSKEYAAGDALHVAHATSNDNGEFELTGLDPATEFVVEAHAVGYVMAEPRWSDRRNWRRPNQAAVEIEMLPLLAAVVGVRVGDLDCTLTATPAMLTSRALRLPKGYRLAFKSVPLDRFSPRLIATMLGLEEHFVVVTAMPKPKGQAAPQLPVICTLRFGVLGLSPESFSFALRPIGSQNWDQPQWLSFRQQAPDAGSVTVIADERGPSGDTLVSGVYLISLDRSRSVWPARWRLRSTANVGEWTARVTAGEYMLTARDSSGRPFEVAQRIHIGAGEHVKFEARLKSAPTLTIDARYASGAAAREVGIRIRPLQLQKRTERGSSRWILEPNGCVGGPEVIPISKWMQGKTLITVTKQGFRASELSVDLSESDVVLRPVLLKSQAD